MLAILLTIVAPAFTLIAIGVIFGKIGVLTKDRTAGLVTFVTYIALPALLFKSLSQGFPDLASAIPTVLALTLPGIHVHQSKQP